MQQVLSSIPSTNVKIIELYNKIISNTLDTSPNDFQRKLVWKKQHKYYFIETILANYPFPEVYIASREMDVSNITSTEVVVDGQQRLSTIVDYIKGDGDFKNQKKVQSFDSLSTEAKKSFLNYLVSVRDLKNIEEEIMKDIFQRINNTEYSLNAIEKTNAQYGDSEFIIFCKQIFDEDFNIDEKFTEVILDPAKRSNILEFFNSSEVFSDNDKKRMADLQFIMTLIATIMEGEYFSRNSKVNKYIKEYNEIFPEYKSSESLIYDSIVFLNKLELNEKSYWFNKSNIFTLIVETTRLIKSDFKVDNLDHIRISESLNSLEEKSRRYFSRNIDGLTTEEIEYIQGAKEAVNEKNIREMRGDFVRKNIFRI
jgi:hypothetical protein